MEIPKSIHRVRQGLNFVLVLTTVSLKPHNCPENKQLKSLYSYYTRNCGF